MVTIEEIERRKPVWLALSEMYLDTELDHNDIQRLVKVLLDSNYSWETLMHIHYNEVAPVVYSNLFSVAGEWSGFDEEWLYKSILHRISSKQINPILYKIFKWYIHKITSHYWNKISMEFRSKSVV